MAFLCALTLLVGGCASPPPEPPVDGPSGGGSEEREDAEREDAEREDAEREDGEATDGSDADDASGDGPGGREGAREMADPQRALTTISPGGDVTQLDLRDGSIVPIGQVEPPQRGATDGRYVFVDDGAGVSVVDSGRWAWDHDDHFHYYRAEPRMVGRAQGEGHAAVGTTNSSTSGGTGIFFAGSGEAVLLDTEALSRGDLVERWRLDVEPHDGLVVPVGSYALVTTPQGDQTTSLVAHGPDGEVLPDLEIDCHDARGTISTRVGAVVGCADGAVLATVGTDGLDLELIPYPAGTDAAPATGFDNRKGRPTVAGLAGEDAIWLLDTRERQWSLLPAPEPLLQVTAVDDQDQHVLALSAGGRVLVIDGETGAELAATGTLLPDTIDDAAALASVSLVADEQRAYLNAPREHRLYEIDFTDTARISRTFDTSSEPTFFAQTGR